MKIFFLVDPKTITKEEQTKEIYYLMFLKKKRGGRVKGGAFENGSE